MTYAESEKLHIGMETKNWTPQLKGRALKTKEAAGERSCRGKHGYAIKKSARRGEEII